VLIDKELALIADGFGFDTRSIVSSNLKLRE
jgi:hypothetical protein